MAQFFIRVVLHNATAQDYVRVQSALASKGIVDRIVGSDGRLWRLPPGEYRCDYDATASDIRSLVRGLLTPVFSNNAVIVVKYTESAWIELEQIPVGASGYANL